MELTIKPQSDRFDEDDARWRDQVVAFHSDLRAEVGGTRLARTPAPGKKSPAADIILALGSSGALSAAVTMFRAWLSRDRTRSLKISWRDGDKERSLSVRAEDLNDETFKEVARAAAQDFNRRQ